MTASFDQVRQHWESWAKAFGTSLRATTKTPTIKLIEIAALTRHIPPGARVLEVGCGNGYNTLAFAEHIRDISILGVDYSAEMIANAKQQLAQCAQRLGAAAANVEFDVADVLALSCERRFDVVVTDRCIINLTTLETQKQAIANIAAALEAGGFFLMLENSRQTYDRQNDAREALGLPRRTPEAFNLFLDEDAILPHCEKYFEVVDIEDIGSLHDLLLYVLVPSLQDGQIDYQHPLVAKAAELTVNLRERHGSYGFGQYGQNRLYVLKKRRE